MASVRLEMAFIGAGSLSAQLFLSQAATRASVHRHTRKLGKGEHVVRSSLQPTRSRWTLRSSSVPKRGEIGIFVSA